MFIRYSQPTTDNAHPTLTQAHHPFVILNGVKDHYPVNRVWGRCPLTPNAYARLLILRLSSG